MLINHTKIFNTLVFSFKFQKLNERMRNLKKAGYELNGVKTQPFLIIKK